MDETVGGGVTHKKKVNKENKMEIMEIQCVALVVLILIGFIQLQTFEVLLEHQRRNVDFYDVMLSSDRSNAFSPIHVLNVLNASEFCVLQHRLLYMLPSAQISKRHFVFSSLDVEPRLIFNGSDNVTLIFEFTANQTK